MRRLLDLLSPIPFPAWFMRFGGSLNTWWLRSFRGRGPLTSNVLILTTRGGRSAQERSTVLLYFDRDVQRYVVASFAGFRRYRDRTARQIPIVELILNRPGRGLSDDLLWSRCRSSAYEPIIQLGWHAQEESCANRTPNSLRAVTWPLALSPR